jgi:hypothetical protein
MTLTNRICCPTCKKQTIVEIREIQLTQMRKEVALKLAAESQHARQNQAAANSEVRFSSTGDKRGSAKRSRNNGERNEQNVQPDGPGTANTIDYNVLVHCSGCDNLFTHHIPLHSLAEAENTPDLPSKSFSATNAHSRLSTVITNERQDKLIEPTRFEDSTVETLTQHFDSFSTLHDVASSAVFSNSGLSIVRLKSLGTGEDEPTAIHLYAMTQRALKIMVETTSFKLLLPSFVVLIGLLAVGFAPQNVLFQRLNAIWPPAHRVPESSVYIEGTQADEIKAANGRKFIAVTGTVRNDGTRPVRDVIIQGLVYQADGSRIHDAIGFAHKSATPQFSKELASQALVDAEITAIERSEIGQVLNPSSHAAQRVIADIGTIAQGNHPKRERELKAGQSQDFTLFIPVEEDQQKAGLLYTARIFTVS